MIHVTDTLGSAILEGSPVHPRVMYRQHVTRLVTTVDSGFLCPPPQIIPGHLAFFGARSEFPG